MASQMDPQYQKEMHITSQNKQWPRTESMVHKPSQVTLKENVHEYFSAIQGSQENKAAPVGHLGFCSLPWQQRVERKVLEEDQLWLETSADGKVSGSRNHLSSGWCAFKAIPISRNTSYRKWNLQEDLEQPYLLVFQAKKTLACHDLSVCAHSNSNPQIHILKS